MKIWSRFPVFRFLIPFSTGIISCIYCFTELRGAIILLLTGFLVAFIFTKRNYATGKYAQRWLAGIPFYCCFFGAGFCYTWLHQSIHYNNHFSGNTEGILILQICENPALTIKGYKLIADVSAIKNGSAWKNVRGKLLLNISDSSHKINPGYGDRLLVKTIVREVQSAHNPGMFDYKKYLESKNVWYNAFADVKFCKIIKKGNADNIFVLAAGFQNLMLQKLKTYVHGDEELGVAGALLLGYEDWLEPDVETSYTAAGVLHVLCVSGMHVGLIYVILAWALSWMEKKAVLRFLRCLLLLLLIWFYAMVTGFSPSVIRAAAMITFIIAGKGLNKESNIYNILCSSCFLMFLLNPYLIISAGFQLSFLAVCGIIFIHKLILPLYEAPNKIIHHLWELISVSLAAQLSTFPLSLYYFHQFPNYFLVANLLVIPLSTMVMYSGLILLVIDWIPYCGWIFGNITTFGITFLNDTVRFIGSLPGAITDKLYITLNETIVLYMLLIFVIIWIFGKSRTFFFGILISIFFLFTIHIISLLNSATQKQFTVYESRNKSELSVIIGNNALVLYDSSSTFQAKNSIIQSHILQQYAGVERSVKILPHQMLSLTSPKGKKILLIKDWKKNYKIPNSLFLKSDIIILSGNITVPLIEILKQVQPIKIIIDSSVKKWQSEKLISEGKLKGINIYSVSGNGAFQLSSEGF